MLPPSESDSPFPLSSSRVCCRACSSRPLLSSAARASPSSLMLPCPRTTPHEFSQPYCPSCTPGTCAVRLPDTLSRAAPCLYCTLTATSQWCVRAYNALIVPSTRLTPDPHLLSLYRPIAYTIQLHQLYSVVRPGMVSPATRAGCILHPLAALVKSDTPPTFLLLEYPEWQCPECQAIPTL